MTIIGIFMVVYGFICLSFAVARCINGESMFLKVRAFGNFLFFVQFGTLLTFNKLLEVPIWYLILLIILALPVAYLNFENLSSTRPRFADETAETNPTTPEKE